MRLKSLERIIEQHFKEEEALCKRLKAILWTVGYAPAQTTRHIRKGSGYILQPYGGLVFIYYEPSISLEERDQALYMLKKYQEPCHLKAFISISLRKTRPPLWVKSHERPYRSFILFTISCCCSDSTL